MVCYLDNQYDSQAKVEVMTEEKVELCENANFYLLGDVAGDGKITSDDLTRFSKLVNNSITKDNEKLNQFTKREIITSDLNGDGVISGTDRTMLRTLISRNATEEETEEETE